MTIAGMSSTGKSTYLEQLRRTFLQDPEVALLSMEFEMLIEDQLERTKSSGFDVKTLEDKNYYFVDNLMDAPTVMATIRAFVHGMELPKNTKYIITIDHTLLVKGRGEKETIDALMEGLVELKKEFASMSIPVSFICLSQLNRDIESDSRVINPLLHYPVKKDLFGSDVVYQTSDYVLVLHRPVLLPAIMGIGYYGKDKYPLRHEGRDIIYGHLIKNRFGKVGIVPYLEDLEHSKLDAISLQAQRVSKRNPKSGKSGDDE